MRLDHIRTIYFKSFCFICQCLKFSIYPITLNSSLICFFYSFMIGYINNRLDIFMAYIFSVYGILWSFQGQKV